MKTAKIISILGILSMTFVIARGFMVGDFGVEGSQLMSMPWGIVSLVDLYVGFTLFSLWIFYREKSTFAAIVWAVAMLTLGFFTGALYVLVNLISSNGDWKKFFLGKNT